MLNPGINELQINRQKLLDGLAANKGFEEGLYESAKNQYAQQCHFIYELLQNAGDAQATKVEFVLSKDALEFRHNGARKFDLNDVDSITNYHQSTKKNSDAVGKFGMGFKAVFHYTTAPEIHSGDYHFRIERMFLPATTGVRTDEKLDGWTKFLFPFNHPNRSTDEIFREVMKGLKDIRSETLLFLKRIVSIECLFEDSSYVKIERQENEHLVWITRQTGSGGKTSSYYFKFVRPLPKMGYGKQLEVALAYALAPKNGKVWFDSVQGLEPSMFKLAPINGRVFVYFPAERETSNLKFHIHASFATPISRESLTECKDNDELLGQIAALAADSLFALKESGLLDIESLAIFPNHRDGLSERYDVIRKRLIKAFNENPLTPTKLGTFKSASDLIRSENRMSDLFTDSDMAAIYNNYASPVWVKAPTMLHSREDEFLSSLDLETFGYEDIISLATGEADNSKRFVNLVQGFGEKKLYDLYKKLAEAADRISLDSYGGFCEIFKTTDDKYSIPAALYFDAGVGGSSTFRFLKKIYKDSDTKLIAFFKEIGIKTYSIETVIKDLLRRTATAGTCSPTAIRDHIQIVKLFVAAFSKDASIVSRFTGFKWLCGNKDSGESLCAAEDVLVDAPYENTGMSYLANATKGRRFLSKRYAEALSARELKIFGQLILKYPFVREYRERYIEKSGYVGLWGHPCYHELQLPYGSRQRDPKYWDCDIDGVEDVAKNGDDALSLIIWQLLPKLKAQSSIIRNPFKATCRHSASCTKTADSLLVCHLRSSRWLKDKSGKWQKPEDVSFSNLHQMYLPRETCEALELIGFGTKAAIQKREDSEKRRVQNELIKELGAKNKKEIEEALELMRAAEKEGIDVKGMILKRRMAAEMPEGATGNAERRKSRVAAAYDDAELQKRELRERSVKTSQSLAQEARKMLAGYYTDDHREMRCQLCHNQMPFSKRDGEAYFECVQAFRDMKKETKEQYLALCPTCAAAYDEWVRKHESNSDHLREAILSRSVADGRGAISVLLPDYGTPNCRKPPISGMSMYFVAKHFIDLRTVLEQEGAS